MIRIRKNDRVEWNLAENPYGYVDGQHVFTLDREGRSYVIRTSFGALAVTGKFKNAEDAIAAAQEKLSEALRAGVSW